MNKILINILLFSTLVIGSIGLISFDVWAEELTTDVYEIPDDYESRNMYIEFYQEGSLTSSGYSFITEEYDFDVYVPNGYSWFLWYCTYSPYNWTNMYPRIFVTDGIDYCNFNLQNISVDKNNISAVNITVGENDIIVYLKNNGSSQYRITRKLKNDNQVATTEYSQSYLALSTLNGHSLYYGSNCNTYKFNQPVVYSGGTYGSPSLNDAGWKAYVVQMSELSKYPPTSNPDYIFNANGVNKNKQLVNDCADAVNKILAKNGMSSFPEPSLLSAKFNDANNMIRLIYERNDDCIPDVIEMYNKVFVKLQNDDEWKTLDNDLEDLKLVSVANNSNYKLIAGAMNIDNILNQLGYDSNYKDAVAPVIEGVIWGLRYGYRQMSGNYKYTGYVFSRYVFEDNLITDTDITIDDLGNLTDIKPGTSGDNGVSVKPGGTENNPIISGTDEADYSDLGSFIKSFNFDFSSIGNAISGSFSLVTGFASMIGNIFQNFFGDGVGIIALLAIGICVVLRVLGR